MSVRWAGLMWVMALAACGGEGEKPITAPITAGVPDAGVPTAPSAVVAEGRYAVTSQIDLTPLALASERAAETIVLLKGLRDDPAGTFFTVLEGAGVPLAKDLYDVLPDVLQGRVQGWINEALLGRGNGVPAELDQLLSIVESTLVRFDLLTDLQLTAAPAAQHLIRGVRYDFLGGRLPVVVPRLVDQHSPINAETELVATITNPAPSGDGALSLGDHAFGVPYGEYALAALNAVSHQRYGAPLRPALGRLFDCPGMGQAVAGKCVGPLCVGHAAELTAICERGLDQVVTNLHERIQGLNFNAVRFQQGDATLWDQRGAEARDGRADRIAGGRWQATIDLGQGPRPVPASFSGLRE
jgi:hypothetical protein